MKTGYRIERNNGSGNGFFWENVPKEFDHHVNGKLYGKIYDRHNNDVSTFPGFYQDTVLYKAFGGSEAKLVDYRFMYPTLKKLLLGFRKDELAQLVKSGAYKVYKISATDYIATPHQIVFKPRSIVTKTDISKIFL